MEPNLVCPRNMSSIANGMSPTKKNPNRVSPTRNMSSIANRVSPTRTNENF